MNDLHSCKVNELVEEMQWRMEKRRMENEEFLRGKIFQLSIIIASLADNESLSSLALATLKNSYG